MNTFLLVDGFARDAEGGARHALARGKRKGVRREGAGAVLGAVLQARVVREAAAAVADLLDPCIFVGGIRLENCKTT